MYIIQITGGREFKDTSAIYNALKPYIDQYGAKNVIVRHGKARGADSYSHFEARKLGVIETNIQARPVQFYNFAWEEGLDAGNKRNIAMLEEEPKPDIVLAFPDDNSRGTWNMVEYAKARHIPVEVYTGALSTDNPHIESIAIEQPIFTETAKIAAGMLFADEIWPGSSINRLSGGDADFIVTKDNEVRAFLEISARFISISDSTETALPLTKHTTAMHVLQHLGTQTLAIVVFKDAFVSFHLSNEPDKVIDDEAIYNHSRFTYHKKG